MSHQLQAKPNHIQVDQVQADSAKTDQSKQIWPAYEAGTTHFTLAERRNAMRVPVIKSAKIVTGGDAGQSVYNCLVLDESPSGVLVDLGAMFNLPEEVSLHMTGGASYKARRCWAVGTKAGLAFTGPQVLSPETVEKLAQLGRMMQAQGLPAAMAALRAQKFFESEDIRRAAESAEAAYHRLETVLLG